MKIQVPTFLRATVMRGTGVRLAIFPLVALFHAAAFAQVSSEETSPNTELPESKQDLASRAGGILRHRCHGCHGPRTQKGDLRLDQEKYLLQPLSSGGTLINTDPTKSELFQRITSSDPDDRMPEDRDPLPANEIKILKRWLEAGSPWDNTEEKEAKAIKRAQLLETWSGWVIPLKPFAAPLAALLFFWLILGRLMRLRLRDTESPPQWQRVVGFLHKRPEALILLALASGFGIKATNAKKSEDQALNKLAIIKNKRAAQLKAGIIRRPLHPARLGGIYYRGNDERNPKLYNNGFYRTCTFEVYLSQGDRRLAIDNPVSKEMPLKIAVKIDRAPFATQKLFNDERMTQASITDQNTAPKQRKKPHGANDDNTMAQRSTVSFHTLEPGESWFAAFALSTDQSGSEEEIEGELFIVPYEKAAPHYGIGYRISIEDGKISADSEIWMGSIYHTADVLIPDERDIPLGHWFDFRPIPVIKDGNTDDPGLLGVKDYLESETKDNKQK